MSDIWNEGWGKAELVPEELESSRPAWYPPKGMFKPLEEMAPEEIAELRSVARQTIDFTNGVIERHNQKVQQEPADD